MERNGENCSRINSVGMVASAYAFHEVLMMKVLIAVDGSDCSSSAVDSIVGRAWSPDTEFLVLSVNEPVYYEYAIPS
ncbi:MAG TPA: universal stress protein, partial [Candidatus Obscuribacter sp.]|nr:universal stress protein [Candidatus Obscuribacter sp.]